MFVRSSLLAAGLVAVLAAPAVAAPPVFAGAVAQGETDTHTYDNNPMNSDCIALAAPYRVTLTFAPTGDALTLTAGGQSVTSTTGVAEVGFWSGVCTRFGVQVTGTSVGTVAPYTVAVRGGVVAGGIDPGSIIAIDG